MTKFIKIFLLSIFFTSIKSNAQVFNSQAFDNIAIDYELNISDTVIYKDSTNPILEIKITNKMDKTIVISDFLLDAVEELDLQRTFLMPFSQLIYDVFMYNDTKSTWVKIPPPLGNDTNPYVVENSDNIYLEKNESHTFKLWLFGRMYLKKGRYKLTQFIKGYISPNSIILFKSNDIYFTIN